MCINAFLMTCDLCIYFCVIAQQECEQSALIKELISNQFYIKMCIKIIWEPLTFFFIIAC